MKKLVAILFFTLISVFSFAQEDRKHMEFMGVEMNGSLEQFAEKLRNKGLAIKDVYDDMIILNGEFAGEQDCEISVLASQGIIYRVSVFFPIRDSWYSLRSDYITFKDALSKKYIKPIKQLETFEYPFELGDGHEITAVKADKCSYISQFKIFTGDIYVAISKFCRLTITYDDYLNMKIYETNKAKEISDDL